MSILCPAVRRPLTKVAVRSRRQEFRALKSTLPKTVADYLNWKPTEPAGCSHVDGYIRSVRAQKKWHFVSLGDGTSIDGLQAVVPADKAEGWDI
jgi:asparaginyl-tRNA synthetase